MNGYVIDLEKATAENNKFRQVLYTAENSQLVLMSLEPNQDIGEEVHELDQFIRVEKGEGKAVLDGVEHVLGDGYAVIIPTGTKHNIINGSDTNQMKLYTLYSPPEHRDGVIHETKEEAVGDEEHFDGITSE